LEICVDDTESVFGKNCFYEDYDLTATLLIISIEFFFFLYLFNYKQGLYCQFINLHELIYYIQISVPYVIK